MDLGEHVKMRLQYPEFGVDRNENGPQKGSLKGVHPEMSTGDARGPGSVQPQKPRRV